jgi:MoxR-like ATPase
MSEQHLLGTGASSANAGEVPSNLTERIRSLRDALLADLVERDVPVRLALLAALAGEHLLLIGPPGTAKSLIARRLSLAFEGASCFERLLTRFTVPEELFGPLSIKALESDRYERLTDAYLPAASVAFLDEIFKANSAILNALLTLLNEREFDNGSRRIKTPLIAAIGASNELPEGEELDALYDRFLLRLHVGPVSAGAFPELLALRGESSSDLSGLERLTPAEIAAVQAAAVRVPVPADIVALLCELREWCLAEGIQVSDRRWRKVVKLLQVSALTNGSDQVSIWDAWLLQHCLWESPEDHEKVQQWYTERVGASAAMDPSRLTLIVTSWEARLKSDQESRSQRRDEQGQLLYMGAMGQETTHIKAQVQQKRGGEPLFLAPANAAERGRGYSGLARLPDRSQGGQGYTQKELELLLVKTRRNYEEFRHWDQRSAYLADRNNWLMEEISLSPLMEPTRHKAVHIDACLAEIGALQQSIAEYRAALAEHIASLESVVRSHIWVTSDFFGPAAESLQETQRVVDTLHARTRQLLDGFSLLPREEEFRAADKPVTTKKPVRKRSSRKSSKKGR